MTLTNKKVTNGCFINFWTKGSKAVVTKPVTFVDKKLIQLTSLEISTDKSIVFGVGRIPEGGCLVAFSNNKFMEFICKEEFLDQPMTQIKKL